MTKQQVRRTHQPSSKSTTVASKTNASDETGDSRKRPRRWWLYGLVVLLLLWIAPIVVGWSPLRQTVVNSIGKKFNGQVTVAGAWWSWFSPVQLTGIQATDPDGNHLLTIEKVTCSNSLFTVLTTGNLGDISIEELDANWVLRIDGSNVEDAIAQYLTSESNGNNNRQQIEIKQSKINFQQLGSNEQYNIELESTLVLNGETAPLTLDASVTSSSQNANDQFSANLEFGSWNHDQQSSFDSGRIELDIQTLDLKKYNVLAHRFVNALHANGRLNGDVTICWKNYTEKIDIDARGLNGQAKVVYPPVFGKDFLALTDFQLSGALSVVDGGFQAEQFKLQSDKHKVEADGRISLDALLALAQARSQQQRDFQVHAMLDIRDLSNMFRNSFGLEQDTEIQSGKLAIALSSKNQGIYRNTLLDLRVQQLNARRGNFQFSHQHPIFVSANIRQDDHKSELQQIKGQSEYVSIDGKGTINAGKLNAEGNLSEVARQIKPFFKSANLDLAGQFKLAANWQTDNARTDLSTGIKFGNLKVDGDLELNHFIVKLPNSVQFAEKQLTGSFSARGNLDNNQRFSIDEGSINILAGPDQLVATLLEPTKFEAEALSLKLETRLTGNLANWKNRLGAFADLSEIQIEGNGSISAQSIVSSSQLQLQNANYEFEDFKFNSGGPVILEPKVIGQLNASYDFVDSSISFNDSTIVSATVSARAQKAKIILSPRFAATGDLAFRGDLHRVLKWFGSVEAESIQWFGEIEGNANISANSDHAIGNIRINAKNLAAARRVELDSRQNFVHQSPNDNQWKQIWVEPKASIHIKFDHDLAADSMTIERFIVESPSLTLSTAGSLSEVSSVLDTQLDGRWQPNWNQLNQLVSEYSLNQISMLGGSLESIHISGPVLKTQATGQSAGMFPKEFSAHSGIGWQQAQLFGIDVGQAKLNMQLTDNQLSIDPVSISVGQGKLNLMPVLDLRSDRPTLTHRQAKLVEQVELSPEICRGWLKFVAPMIADSTDVQGRFSVVTDGLSIPVTDPWNGIANGGIHIHRATMGPGPLSRQLIETTRLVKSIMNGNPLQSSLVPAQHREWIEMPEQMIPVQLKDQRVYHKGVRFRVGDVELTTRGYVAKDQSLNLTAEIPVRDEWIQGKVWLAGLKGQSFQIPITGSVSKPTIDRSVLQQASRSLLRNAAGSALKNQLQNRFDKEVDKGFNQLDDELKKGLKGLFGGDR